VPCDVTAGGFTVKLPQAPPDQTRVCVKLVGVANAVVNTLTIAAQGTDVINKAGGPASGTFTMVNQAATWQYAAATGIWYVISDDTPFNAVKTVVTSPLASDQNLLAWSYDPAVPGASSSPTGGTIQLIRLILRTPALVTNVLAHVATAGSGLTAAQNLAGLYTAAGALLSGTADQTASWGSTGLKTMALTTPQNLAAGNYYAALLSVGTTPPQFSRSGGLTAEANLLNAGLASSAARFATGPASLTALPASITMSGIALAAVGYWAALS
jgi:hypothetical protein